MYVYVLVADLFLISPLSGFSMRRKFRVTFTGFLLLSVIFVTYQMIMLLDIKEESKRPPDPKLLRGIHVQEALFYEPDDQGMFTCTHSLEKLPFDRVNDDYCDCLDGSDEPGTSACANGKFYCATQKNKYFMNSIGSQKVNDGICDCCDGSDEWENVQIIKDFNVYSQQRANHFHPPCPNLC